MATTTRIRELISAHLSRLPRLSPERTVTRPAADRRNPAVPHRHGHRAAASRLAAEPALGAADVAERSRCATNGQRRGQPFGVTSHDNHGRKRTDRHANYPRLACDRPGGWLTCPRLSSGPRTGDDAVSRRSPSFTDADRPLRNPDNGGCACASACRLSPIDIAVAAAYPPPRAAVTPRSSPPRSSVPASSRSARARLPDAKSVSPSVLDELKQASVTSQDVAARADAADRASRDSRAEHDEPTEPDVWLLPLQGYDFNSPYGMRWGKLHTGVDLVAREGTPYVGDPRRHGHQGRLVRRLRLRGDRPARRRQRGHLRPLLRGERQGGPAGQGRRPARPGRQHRPLLRRPPAPGDPCQRRAAWTRCRGSRSAEWTSSCKSRQSTAT